LTAGKFDYLGSSHQWWHLIAVIIFVWWHDAGLQLLTFQIDHPCHTPWIFHSVALDVFSVIFVRIKVLCQDECSEQCLSLYFAFSDLTMAFDIVRLSSKRQTGLCPIWSI